MKLFGADIEATLDLVHTGLADGALKRKLDAILVLIV
jgi:hypothetical protein